jgi:hypothetical protein
MNIVVDIGHPGHVHFFRHFIAEMERRGHSVKVTATDKEMAHGLLSHYGIPFTPMGRHVKSLARKLVDVPRLDARMYRALRGFEPDLFLGIASYRAAQTAKLMGAKSFIFDDTEHAKMARRLYLPFATRVYTPSCFLDDIGPKQVRYLGYHELAYLHPKRFEPDASVLDELGMAKGEKYAIIRFVAWTAGHDAGHAGLSADGKMEIVEAISREARPVITSEGKLPTALEKYRSRLPPWRIHDAMAFASVYLGEGATMASEAAMLGVPSVYVNELSAGTLEEQARLGLLLNLRDSKKASAAVPELLEPEKRREWRERRDRMLEEKADVTGYMAAQVAKLEEADEVPG